jgi:hypothetical protein
LIAKNRVSSTKPWADQFLGLRATLYFDEMGEEMKSRFNGGSSGGTFVDPNETRNTTAITWRNYPMVA